MILTENYDAGFNDETNERSIAGAHIFIYENEIIQRCNGPILTIAKMMKYVTSSAVEA